MSKFSLSESKCDEVFKNILRSSPATGKHLEHRSIPYSEKNIIKNEEKTDIFNPEYKVDNSITCRKFYEPKTNINIYNNTNTFKEKITQKRNKIDIDKVNPPKTEVIKSQRQTIDRERKIKDTYTSSSMPDFDADLSVKYNQMTRDNKSAKVNRVNSIFTSEGLKTSVFNHNDNYYESSDKITSKMQHAALDDNPKRYVKSFRTITSNGKTIYQ